MIKERSNIFSFAGKPVTIVGEDIQIGQIAPEFSAQQSDWSIIPVLKHTSHKVRIITAIPSLSTSVCDREIRRFNHAASAMDENIVIITISTDLPFTQKIWCGTAGIDKILVVSDHLNVEFGKKYGCLIKEIRALRRAVFIVNQNQKITYAAYMPALGDEPDYDTVLQEAKKALTNA